MESVDLSHLEQRPIACNLCGGADARPLVVNCGLHIEQCRSCGLVAVNPQPTDEALRRHYGTDQLESAQPWDSYFRHPQHQIEELWRQRLDDMQRRIGPPRGRLLDVGSGWGDFMHYAAGRGYDVHGFEFSQQVAQVSRDKYRVQVAVGDINELRLLDNTYDVVTMWHVLEHVADPSAVLDHIWRLLRPGGTLVIEVPNLNFLVRKSYRYPLSQTLHLYHFSGATLSALLERRGFRVQSCTPGHTGYLYGRPAKRMAKRGIYAVNAAVFGLTGHNVGDSVRAFAVKGSGPQPPAARS
jgi:2-polyprenyl-3-methyl-5-hydroxy-6-metoxy-1,4-benzoquinol methylase